MQAQKIITKILFKKITKTYRLCDSFIKPEVLISDGNNRLYNFNGRLLLVINVF